MRIYMVLTGLLPLGGTEAALVPLTRELQVRGHEVHVHVLQRPRRPNQNVDALDRIGVASSNAAPGSLRLARLVTARRAGLVRTLCWLALPVLVPQAALDSVRTRGSFLSSLRAGADRLGRWLWPRVTLDRVLYRSLARRFDRLPPDVVHVHGWGCGEDPPGALAWLRRFPYAVAYSNHNSPDPRRQEAIVDAPMNLADVLVAVSEAGRIGLRDVGRASRPIRVIPYGVDPLPAFPRLERREDEFVVTCLGRLHPQKGQADLIEAFARLRSVAPGALLRLAGIGSQEAALQAKARLLGLESRVEFLGLVPRSSLHVLFAGTDVVALPSYWEGLPVALIEALAAGKPIVATDAGGNPELVRHGENGLIVAKGDVDGLSSALLRLVEDPPLRARMGAAGLARFQTGEFAPDRVAQLHEQVYRLAVERRRERRSERSVIASP